MFVARFDQDLTANHLLVIWAYWILDTIFDDCHYERTFFVFGLLANLNCLLFVTLNFLASLAATMAGFQGVARQNTIVYDRKMLIIDDLCLQLLFGCSLFW